MFYKFFPTLIIISWNIASVYPWRSSSLGAGPSVVRAIVIMIGPVGSAHWGGEVHAQCATRSWDPQGPAAQEERVGLSGQWEVETYLVGGLVAIFYFPIYWESNHPNWLSYFSEGWPNHQPAIYFTNELYFICSRGWLKKIPSQAQRSVTEVGIGAYHWVVDMM